MNRRDEEAQSQPIDDTLRRVVVIFRVLGLLWMAMLVVATVVDDPGANPAVAVGALLLATAWTVATVVAARNPDDPMRSPWFVFGDGVVALLVASASFYAGAKDLFHGGYPMSWILVAAYAGGVKYAVGASLVLFGHQVVMYAVDGSRNLVPTLGNIVFVVFAIVLGWAVEALRAADEATTEAQTAVARAEADKARHQERASLATKLHDSVLQTLHVIRRDADDAAEVRYLARRQERELRRTIGELTSPYERSFAAALLVARDEIEDLQRIEIEAVVRDDAPLTSELEALVAAAREAMNNAAKHAGVDRIDLYAEVDDGTAIVHVRDRGSGYEGEISTRLRRLEDVGGTVAVRSEIGSGTDVSLEVPA